MSYSFKSLVFLLFIFSWKLSAEESSLLSFSDVFEFQYSSTPRISPDGKTIAYLKHSMDIMSDRKKSELWITDPEGKNHQKISLSQNDASGATFSPDGKFLYFNSKRMGRSGLFRYNLQDKKIKSIAPLQITSSPSHLSISPDGTKLIFSLFIPEDPTVLVENFESPEGSKWAPSPEYIESFIYRVDGTGYLNPGHFQIFLYDLNTKKLTQLTTSPFDHRGPFSWDHQGKSIYFSSRRLLRSHPLYSPLNNEIYQMNIEGKYTLKALTNRYGQDYSPTPSPDGKWLAYLGYFDEKKSYHSTSLSLMNLETGERKTISGLDFDIHSLKWNASGTKLYLYYDEEGMGKLSLVTWDFSKGLITHIQPVIKNIGGTATGRPYTFGEIQGNSQDEFVFTYGTDQRPAEIAYKKLNSSSSLKGPITLLTKSSEELLSQRKLGRVEEVRFQSNYDKRPLHGWIVYPPNYNSQKKYPLLMEIHGGPHLSYGPWFSLELQLYAASGFMVFYMNPRGSTSYGEEFARLIHHNYPGEDFDDLMSGIDYLEKRNLVDSNNLFVTGGSGGGVLSSWIVGHTNRFAAAAVIKPIVNWYSFALTADYYEYFVHYWFPGLPWEYPDHYMKRSPISYVDAVETPTMLMTGIEDYRTPIGESEQFYQALQLRGIESSLVRIPGASHAIAARPSHLMNKVKYILEWFKRYLTE